MAVLCRLAALLLVAGVGGVLTAVLYNWTASSEVAAAKDSFKGSFSAALPAFDGFLQQQLRALCGISDALSVQGAVPSVEDFSTVRGGWAAYCIARVDNNRGHSGCW